VSARLEESPHDVNTREGALNAALLTADISRSYEEYVALVDCFYADDVEAASEGSPTPVVGRGQLRALMTHWLLPLHVMAEIGGLSVTLQLSEETPTDVIGTRHSAWVLELVGATGSRCTLTWSCSRKWKDARVVSEYHYNHHQTGGPLGWNDLQFSAATDWR
jgi:hypothetical protein